MADDHTTSPELLPCPFCGKNDYQCGELLNGWNVLACDNCGARGPYAITGTREQAWNTRQPQSPSTSLSDALAECGCPPHCCCCGVGEPCCDCGMVRPSAACIGESCFCGEPAVKKVGEEILFDDPLPNRHNLTAYVCATHYSQIMGPLGVKQVGLPEAIKPKEQSNGDR